MSFPEVITVMNQVLMGDTPDKANLTAQPRQSFCKALGLLRRIGPFRSSLSLCLPLVRQQKMTKTSLQPGWVLPRAAIFRYLRMKIQS